MPDYTNQGYLSRNKFYEEGSRKPPYTGKLNANGTDYELAAWVKERDDGSKYFSLKVSSKERGEENQDAGEVPF